MLYNKWLYKNYFPFLLIVINNKLKFIIDFIDSIFVQKSKKYFNILNEKYSISSFVHLVI